MRRPELTKPGGNQAMWEPFTVLNRNGCEYNGKGVTQHEYDDTKRPE